MKLTQITVLLAILFSTTSGAAPWGGKVQPVFNVNSSYASLEINNTFFDGTAATLPSIEKAIVAAITARAWLVTKNDEATHTIQAEILVRERHYAKAEIKYSTTNYSITYMDSRGLQHRGGQIHRNYNKWVKLLNKAIREKLMFLN